MKKQAMSESANWSCNNFCLSAAQQLNFNTETTEVTFKNNNLALGADRNTNTRRMQRLKVFSTAGMKCD